MISSVKNGEAVIVQVREKVSGTENALLTPVRPNATKRDERSSPDYRDHEQIIEESARGGRIWHILMLEGCQLQLFGNSASETGAGAA